LPILLVLVVNFFEQASVCKYNLRGKDQYC
jgi:hypothetical protein